ncbi:MAG: HAD family hydrolase [Thermoplasmata archaeon]|nr:HAD family hydrolase [Thermoplasmata archaeon]MBE3140479.1 HAD family hydrolase [Thermoplasmata archaeon]
MPLKNDDFLIDYVNEIHYWKTFLYQRMVLLFQKNMKLQPSAILFDMDGVLVDSLDSWWKALNSALKKFKHQELTRDEFIETYWGHDLRANLKRLKLNPKVAPFCNITYGDHLDYIRIYPDTKSALKQLVSYKKAVITNTPTDCVRQILKKFDITQYFEAIITSDDVLNAKPDPEIVFAACKQLGVTPKTALLVGDTESDVKAGRAAGCIVIGLNIDADITIQRLSELTDLVL